MTDVKKIIKGLKWVLEDDRFSFGEGWPIDSKPQIEEEWAGYYIQRAIDFLKEQEGVEPIFDCEEPILQIGQFHCGNCNHSFGISHYRYCPYCGKPVKWKGE